MMVRRIDFKGLFPAPAIPLDNNLDIIDAEFASHVRRMSDTDGVGGLVVNGHAGEVTTLSSSERQHVVELARKAAQPSTTIVAGIESLSTEGAIQRAREAKYAGADAALVLPPFDYFPRRAATRTWHAPYRFFSDLAENVDLPLVVFQYPLWTGVSYTTETLVRLTEIESVMAVKNAVWNTSVYAEQYEALQGKVPVLAACDAPELLGMMLIGADGALIGISNIATDKWAAFVTNCLADKVNDARRLFVSELMPIMEYVFGDIESHTTSFNAMTKEALRQLGIFSNSWVRPPELDVTNEDREAIRHGLELAKLLFNAGMRLNNRPGVRG
jgi:4-hydroxy-tetrahydrodipicolinate synthase